MLSFHEMFAIFRNKMLVKQLLVYLMLAFLAPAAMGQYYLRGEIVDEKKQPVQNCKNTPPLQQDGLLFRYIRRLWY
jgi:hypothetical protein